MANDSGEFIAPAVEMRAVMFDIETTAFTADGNKGILLCACLRDLSKRQTETLRLEFDDKMDDRRLLDDVITALGKYQIVIGHNIIGFDLPWLFSRLAFHRMATPPTWLYIDTYFMAKSIALKAERKSLAFLLDYFQLAPQKTAVYPVEWNDSRSHNEQSFEDALAAITKHCRLDVEDNVKLFDSLYPLVVASGQNPVKRTRW